MFRKVLITFFVIISIIACKSKTNQIVNNHREGKWITIDTLDEIYITKGKYRNGNEVGTWKQFRNGKLVKKEKYLNGTSHLKFYYNNGKIMKKGHAKTDYYEKENHWYYFGKWYFYNTKGKLDSVETYKKENYEE